MKRQDTAYQFRILIYPSEGDDGSRFTAHCLSMDLVAVDDTVEGAVSELLETIEASLEAARKHNANKRHGTENPPLIDVERQCDMRQLEVA